MSRPLVNLRSCEEGRDVLNSELSLPPFRFLTSTCLEVAESTWRARYPRSISWDCALRNRSRSRLPCRRKIARAVREDVLDHDQPLFFSLREAVKSWWWWVSNADEQVDKIGREKRSISISRGPISFVDLTCLFARGSLERDWTLQFMQCNTLVAHKCYRFGSTAAAATNWRVEGSSAIFCQVVQKSAVKFRSLARMIFTFQLWIDGMWLRFSIRAEWRDKR